MDRWIDGWIDGLIDRDPGMIFFWDVSGGEFGEFGEFRPSSLHILLLKQEGRHGLRATRVPTTK